MRSPPWATRNSQMNYPGFALLERLRSGGLDRPSGRLIRQSHALGYHPTRFEKMLSDLGARRLVKKLVISEDLQDGLKEMSKSGHKELPLEAIMLEARFKSPFTTAELQAADWRLRQV